MLLKKTDAEECCRLAEKFKAALNAQKCSVNVSAAIGTAVYMMSGKRRNARKMKRGAAKTIHAVENIVSGISDMVR